MVILQADAVLVSLLLYLLFDQIPFSVTCVSSLPIFILTVSIDKSPMVLNSSTLQVIHSTNNCWGKEVQVPVM